MHLFKDCYSSFTDIENTLEQNETDVPVEAECIAPSRENSEASRHNLEAYSSTQYQDQYIGQEQIQKRMEQENEIKICKFCIKKCCKHGLRGNNSNYPHLAPCKKYIENPECRCGPECTNYQPRYMQIFYAIQKVLQRQMLQNSP